MASYCWLQVTARDAWQKDDGRLGDRNTIDKGPEGRKRHKNRVRREDELLMR